MAKAISRRSFLGGGAAFAVGTAAFGFGLAGCSGGQAKKQEAKDSSQGEMTPADHIQADVVVAGSGTAGCTAAIAAAQAGAKVVLLEKMGVLGGNSSYAGTIFAVNSHIQLEGGFETDPEEIIKSAAEWHEYNFDRPLFSKLVYASADNIRWIADMGVQLVAPPARAKTTLAYTGDVHSGQNAINVFQKKLEELGVDVRTSTPATKIVMSEGKVAGLIAETESKEYVQFDAPAVIIAAGAFGADDQMVRELCRRDTSKIEYRGLPGATGDSYRMVQEVGGYSTGVCTACTNGPTVAESALDSSVNIMGAMQPTNLWVNQDGQRFMAENKLYSQLGNAVLMQGRAYSFCDSKAVAYYTENGVTAGFADVVLPGTKFPELASDLDAAAKEDSGLVAKANSIEELAAALNIDAKTAAMTVTEYNADCERGEDSVLGKDAKHLIALDTPPYYGFRLHANNMNTMGGVRTNLEMQVVDGEHVPIPGLYCAGLDVEGFEGTTYDIGLAGTNQAIAVFTGRIAGTNAAKMA